MSADDEILEAVGLWECGTCHRITDTTHYFMNRTSGVMSHEADPDRRERFASECGWRFDDDYGTVVRCSLRYDHRGEHVSGGMYPIRWTDSRGSGAIPPYDPSTANTAGPESGEAT